MSKIHGSKAILSLRDALNVLRRNGHTVERYSAMPSSPAQGRTPAWLVNTWIFSPADGLPTRLSTARLLELAASIR